MTGVSKQLTQRGFPSEVVIISQAIGNHQCIDSSSKDIMPKRWITQEVLMRIWNPRMNHRVHRYRTRQIFSIRGRQIRAVQISEIEVNMMYLAVPLADYIHQIPTLHLLYLAVLVVPIEYRQHSMVGLFILIRPMLKSLNIRWGGPMI